MQSNWGQNVVALAPYRAPQIRHVTTSQNGVNLIISHEKFSPVVYRDSAGHPTIGYGHKLVIGDGLNHSSQITEAQGRVFLQRDLTAAEAAVRAFVRAPLTQNQFDALVSLVYNIGRGKFANSQLLNFVNAGLHSNAAREFLRWIHAGGQVSGGLIARRTQESNLYAA